ncbi:MAG: Trm112 family protein [bacterium]|nr:Trm112 family protein [bacterium]
MNIKLFKILACPLCKKKVSYDKKNQKLICPKCKRKYPIRQGIPIMLINEAER